MTSDLDTTLAALRRVRLRRPERPESEIHDAIAAELAAAGVAAEHEARVGPRLRPDFLTAGGTLVEVKKRRPNATRTIAQLSRYAGHKRVRAIVLVSERGVPFLPEDLSGKPLRQVSLAAVWGVAV